LGGGRRGGRNGQQTNDHDQTMRFQWRLPPSCNWRQDARANARRELATIATLKLHRIPYSPAMRASCAGLLLFAACGGASGKAGNPDGSIVGNSALDLSLRDQVSAIETGSLTGNALATGYLARIADRDTAIHAVIVTDPQAAAAASALDGQ